MVVRLYTLSSLDMNALELELAWFIHHQLDTQLVNLIDDIMSV